MIGLVRADVLALVLAQPRRGAGSRILTRYGQAGAPGAM
jgi:hypothetical protein